MSPINLLHVVNEFADASSNRLILDLIERLDREEYSFHIGCVMDVNGPLEAMFHRVADRVVNFGQHGSALQIIARIQDYVEHEQIDFVHTHVLRADILGGIAGKRSSAKALFSTKHNMAYPRGHTRWWLKNIFYWGAMLLPDHIITVTEALRQQILAGLRIRPHRVSTIYSGVSADLYYQPQARGSSRESLGFSDQDLIICYAGRLVGGKGIELLIQSLPEIIGRFPEAKLLIVGEGRLRAKLEEMASQAGIAAQIVFAGFRQDIPGLLAASDIFILPSLSEGLPKSILEAMAARKAVVATSVGGVGELIDPNVTGILIPPNDGTSLVESVCSLLEDGDRRRQLGSQAREYVIEHFGLGKMVAGYEELYRAYTRRHEGNQTGSDATGRIAREGDIA